MTAPLPFDPDRILTLFMFCLIVSWVFDLETIAGCLIFAFGPILSGTSNKKSFNKLKNGILYLKGGDIIEELNSVKRYKKKVYELHEYFSEPFFETKKLVHIY